MNESSCYSIFWSAFCIVRVLDFGCVNIVVFYCSNLYFPNDLRCWVSFHMLICHLYLLTRYLFRSFVYFLIRLFIFLYQSFQSSLYTLENSPFSDMSFVNIFPKSVACIFILLILSFAEQKF